MDHIVQFAISIDDDRIKQSVEQNAEKQIIKDLKQNVLNNLLTSRYYHGNATPDDPLSSVSETIIRQVFKEHEEQIIDKAAKLLADKLARSKSGKAILEDLT